jgi:hypothetical protein
MRFRSAANVAVLTSKEPRQALTLSEATTIFLFTCTTYVFEVRYIKVVGYLWRLRLVLG